jgi:hypothetical protein
MRRVPEWGLPVVWLCVQAHPTLLKLGHRLKGGLPAAHGLESLNGSGVAIGKAVENACRPGITTSGGKDG